MEQKTVFKITKTYVGSVRFFVESAEHTVKEIYLDEKRPYINLPVDWAVGVFRNADTYNMYKAGYFTFGDDADEIARIAIEKGEYFEDPTLVPKKVTFLNDILTTLKSGSKTKIEELCKLENSQNLVAIIREHYNEISAGTIKIIEKYLGIDLQDIIEDEE